MHYGLHLFICMVVLERETVMLEVYSQKSAGHGVWIEKQRDGGNDGSQGILFAGLDNVNFLSPKIC
jgi:hypothetical protein